MPDKTAADLTFESLISTLNDAAELLPRLRAAVEEARALTAEVDRVVTRLGELKTSLLIEPFQ